MAVTATPYAALFNHLALKRINLTTDALKVMLTTSTYTPNRDTHAFQSDVTNEITGTGYTAGGVAMTSLTWTYTTANSWGTSRANTTAYTTGQIVRPATGNGFLYQASTGGTSGGSIPTYPTTMGSTVTDGTVVWTLVGQGIYIADAADPSWASATITARYAVIYDSTPGTAATNPLIGYINFGVDVTSTAAAFTIVLDPLGYLYFLA